MIHTFSKEKTLIYIYSLKRGEDSAFEETIMTMHLSQNIYYSSICNSVIKPTTCLDMIFLKTTIYNRDFKYKIKPTSLYFIFKIL